MFAQVVGIPYWNDESLKSVIDQTNFSGEVIEDDGEKEEEMSVFR